MLQRFCKWFREQLEPKSEKVCKLQTYHGRPVKRVTRLSGNRRKLTFVSPTPGRPGEQIRTTQADLDANLVVRWLPESVMPDVRALARNARS